MTFYLDVHHWDVRLFRLVEKCMSAEENMTIKIHLQQVPGLLPSLGKQWVTDDRHGVLLLLFSTNENDISTFEYNTLGKTFPQYID